MPVPYKLTMNCDIWTSNTDQKLQILEQIFMLFNPSLEIQTTDNYIDWTSLSVLNMDNINYNNFNNNSVNRNSYNIFKSKKNLIIAKQF